MLSKIVKISSKRIFAGTRLKECLKMPNLLERQLKQTLQRVSTVSREAEVNVVDPSAHIKNVYKDFNKKYLRVAWSDGTASRFPYNYLRDNCKCPECFEPSSKQKLFNMARDIRMTVEVEDAVVSEDGLHLKCLWPGGHESRYTFDWLHSTKLPEEDQIRPQNSDSLVKDELILWNREMMQDNIPTYDYEAVMNDDNTLFESLYCFYQHGLIVMDNAPKREGVLTELTARLGYSKTTHYGETFNVKDIKDPSNLAYTTRFLNFHIDLPFCVSPPHFQLLHFIQANKTGGSSIFVDAFNAAKELQKNHYGAFEVLRDFCVQYADYGTDAYGEFMYGFSRPIIDLNRHGRIQNFFYNPSVESDCKGDYTPDELLQFYDACCALTKVLYHPNNMVDVHVKSGQIVMFHNTRVLHGRSAFESTAGKYEGRWLEGNYYDWDVIFSKLRVLQKKLGLTTPYIHEHSNDFF